MLCVGGFLWLINAMIKSYSLKVPSARIHSVWDLLVLHFLLILRTKVGQHPAIHERKVRSGSLASYDMKTLL